MFAAHCSHLSSVYVVSKIVMYYTPYKEQIKAAVINFLLISQNYYLYNELVFSVHLYQADISRDSMRINLVKAENREITLE